MKIVQAPRASAIIYNLLAALQDSRPWLLPANICPIVPITFFKARVPFDLVDISEDTLHVDLDQVYNLLKQRKFGGFLYAHTYGEPSIPQDFFGKIKTEFPGLFVLDDRCLCIPQTGPDPETNADLTLFSTGYSKVVDLKGGGFAFLKEDVPYQPTTLPYTAADHETIEQDYKRAIRARRDYEYHDSDWLESHPQVPAWHDYSQQIEGKINGAMANRAELNGIYSDRLPRDIQLPAEYQNWRFNIRVKNQGKILTAIFDSRLFASAHYASLAGIMTKGRAPQAEALAGEVINLFNSHRFTTSQAEEACKIILENLS